MEVFSDILNVVDHPLKLVALAILAICLLARHLIDPKRDPVHIRLIALAGVVLAVFWFVHIGQPKKSALTTSTPQATPKAEERNRQRQAAEEKLLKIVDDFLDKTKDGIK